VLSKIAINLAGNSVKSPMTLWTLRNLMFCTTNLQKPTGEGNLERIGEQAPGGKNYCLDD
jgi:hypothetical protein